KPAAPRDSSSTSSGIRNGGRRVHRRERGRPGGAATKAAPEKELALRCRFAAHLSRVPDTGPGPVGHPLRNEPNFGRGELESPYTAAIGRSVPPCTERGSPYSGAMHRNQGHHTADPCAQRRSLFHDTWHIT